MAELSPSWELAQEIGHEADSHDNSTAAYYYLTHRAIDEMYKHARQLGVPMQDWHSWIEKQLDGAVGRYLGMDEVQREKIKGELEGIVGRDGVPTQPTAIGFELSRTDSASVIAAIVSGKLDAKELRDQICRDYYGSSGEV